MKKNAQKSVVVCALALAATLVGSDRAWASGEAKNDFDAAKTEILTKFADASLSEDMLYRYALQGMLAGLNQRHPDWNRIYSPVEYEQLRAELSGQVVGIGIELSVESATGSVTILGVLPGSPAAKAGLRARDRILQIDGKTVTGKSLSDIVAALRGKAGAPVNLMLLRDGNVFAEAVDREPIEVSTVESSVAPNGTTVIAINGFNDGTASELRKALESSAGNHGSGLVVDLRQNPGGSLNAMLDAVSLLVPEGTGVAIAHYRQGKEEKIGTRGAPMVSHLPTAVLVDGSTACAAEMMAEALRNALGATIVGHRTEGKWNEQTVEELPDHYAMKYTVATLSGPNGEAFDGVGITPDILVDSSAGDSLEATRRLPALSDRMEKDAALRNALGVLKLK